jgi:hypothetical protein
MVEGAQPDDDTIPDSASLTAHVTVTSLLFQPAAFAFGEREAVMTGGVASTALKIANGDSDVTSMHTCCLSTSTVVGGDTHTPPSKC